VGISWHALDISLSKGPAVPQPDLSSLYDAHYYRSYGGKPGDAGVGDETWQLLATAMARGIVAELRPETLLDVGCGRGFLVAALRDCGVQASGMDFSPYALEHLREDIRPFCWQGVITDPLPQRYDVVTCMEVLEHLPAEDARRAIEVLCAAADDVLFSSTSTDFAEQTHINVRPVEYWAALFAQHGFFRDVDLDPLSLNHKTIIRFRKRVDPVHRIVADYERRFWALLAENAELRLAALESKAAFGQQEEKEASRSVTPADPDVAVLELTIAEQRQHLDALTDRLSFMSDRESDLRTLVHDAHEQLLQRDAGLQPLRDEIERYAQLYHRETAARDAAIEAIEADSAARLAIIHRVTASVEQFRSAADEGRAALEVQAAQTEQLTAELASRDAALARSEAALAQSDATVEELRRAMAARPAATPTPEAEVRPVAVPVDVPAPQPHASSLVADVRAAVLRQRGVWRIQRGYRKLRRRLQW